MCTWFSYCIIVTELTLEQHGFGLHGSTYMQIKKNIAVLQDTQMVKSMNAEPRIGGLTMGLEHPRILVSAAGPGTNAL